jgi:hypothetical protein
MGFVFSILDHSNYLVLVGKLGCLGALVVLSLTSACGRPDGQALKKRAFKLTSASLMGFISRALALPGQSSHQSCNLPLQLCCAMFLRLTGFRLVACHLPYPFLWNTLFSFS